MESNPQLFSRGMPSLTPIAEAFRAQLIGGASERARDFNDDGNRAEPINDYRARRKKRRPNAGASLRKVRNAVYVVGVPRQEPRWKKGGR